VAEGEGGEGALGAVISSVRWLATSLGHQTWAAALSRNRGERRGAADAVQAQLTSGAGTSRGPSVSDGLWEGEG
jgi:hypothetical protein